jgi:hypothetical protein
MAGNLVESCVEFCPSAVGSHEAADLSNSTIKFDFSFCAPRVS